MHPTAIVLVFIILILLVVTGTILTRFGGQRLNRYLRRQLTGKAHLLTGSLFLLFGVFTILYSARGIFRIVWEG